MPAGRPSKYKTEFCEQLIAHMAKGKSFHSFAGTIDVCFDTLHEWEKQHSEFSDSKRIGLAKLLLFDEDVALAGSTGQLKRVSRVERTTDENGVTKEVTFHEAAQFAQTYHIFKLKNRYPKLYRDKIQIETSTSEDAKKTSKVLQDVMSDPVLAEAARIIAEKLSEE